MSEENWILPKVGETWVSNNIAYIKYKNESEENECFGEIKEITDDGVVIMCYRNGVEDFYNNVNYFLKNFKKVELETNETKASEKEISAQNPSYYQQGKIEVWDFILDQNLGYLEGCIIKYLCRYKKKNGLEDLHKAKNYLEKLIEVKSKK